MKGKLFLLSTFFIGFSGLAQIQVGFESNSQWYVDDKKVKIDANDAEERFRSNNYLKFDYTLKNWTFGAQLEGYVPKAILNYAPDFDKVDIGTVFARYNNVEEGVDVTAGHFYEQYGSGLLLRSWEDRQIGINNAILGINAKFAPFRGVRIGGLGGKQRVGMGFDLSESFILGSNLEIDIADIAEFEDISLRLGASYVGRFEDTTTYNENLDKSTNAFSTRVDFGIGNFYIGSEYVFKQKDVLIELGRVDPKVLQAGSALLVNTGYSQKGFSVNVNLRRMENMAFYSQRDLYGNIYNKASINYIPALTKQYDYSLQNIYVYQAQPSFDMNLDGKLGEIGGQFDLYYEFQKGTTLGGQYGTNLVMNGSYWSGLKAVKNPNGKGVTSDFFEFGEKYYRDLGVEVRKKWSGNWSSIFMYLNQYYNSPYLNGKFEAVNASTASAETTYQFGDSKSIRLELQHLWADTDKKNWAGGTLEFAANANWAFFVTDIYNYGNDKEDEQIHYYNGGVSFSKGVSRISASYGRQRGGLLCVGGVCRMVSEAAGLTVGISTSF